VKKSRVLALPVQALAAASVGVGFDVAGELGLGSIVEALGSSSVGETLSDGLGDGVPGLIELEVDAVASDGAADDDWFGPPQPAATATARLVARKARAPDRTRRGRARFTG
jgi:hypothetical protein